MIIKSILRLHSRIPSLITNSLQFLQSTNKNELTTHLRVDLVEKLQKMNIRTSKSIFMEEVIEQQQEMQEESIEKGKKLRKKNKYQHRILTVQEKKELGLMIPQSPFNLRVTRKSQQKYRHALCQDLYQAQKDSLPASVRILQMQNTPINVDQYINSIYKDIFSRYMISRGLGVEWEANHSNYGVMNPKLKTKQSRDQQIKQFYKWLTALMQEYPLSKREVIGVYSYSHKKYIPIDQFQVENVYKIGYFFTMNLTKFGKYKESFGILSQRGQKIDLLIMVEDPIKLLNIQAICIENNMKMIILSKYQQNQTTSSDNPDESKINSYLITSMQVFTDHKQYFTKNGYTKHSLFDSKHLLEMEVGNGIKILQQIQGYERKAGAYIVDRFSSLPDFQRAQQYELAMKKSYLDENGKIICPQQKSQVDAIYITDPKYSQKLLARQMIMQHSLSDYNINVKQLDLYATYQDQIYSYNQQKLHFKIAYSYIIPIPQSHQDQLELAISKSILTQSKVKVPTLNKYYPKPRDKRRHKKQIKQLLKQETQYMSLKDSLQSIEHLGFSTIHNEDTNLGIPIFVKKMQREGKEYSQQVLVNKKIQDLLNESVLISHLQNESIKVSWDHSKLNQYLQSLQKQMKENKLSGQIQLKYVPLTKNLFNAFLTFKNYSSHSELSNVVVQPQSKTEDVVPYFFHLHFMLHKMLIKQSAQKERGRRTKQTINKFTSQYTNKLFSLIKFHPTIDQSQRKRNIDEILFGVLKANNEQQYGYGLQALRLWIARNDQYLGDRKLSDKEVNKQLELSAFIRKMYWEILPLVNIDLDKIIVNDANNEIQIHHGSNNQIDRDKLSYLHRFMIDHINYYILNMEEFYKKLQLAKALALTQDFFRNYLNQIFVKTVRKRIISYPLHEQTKQHIYILKKILDLLAVVYPLLPYSAYHISKVPMMRWPEVKHEDVRPQLILDYNRMTKLRVEVRNKFLLNTFYHSELVIPIERNKEKNADGNKYWDDLPEIWRLSKQDLELFFDIENISLEQPTQMGKSFKLKLTHNHPIGQLPAIKFYEYKEVCIRCSPTRNYGTHLCQKCLDYLNNNYNKKLPLNS